MNEIHNLNDRQNCIATKYFICTPDSGLLRTANYIFIGDVASSDSKLVTHFENENEINTSPYNIYYTQIHDPKQNDVDLNRFKSKASAPVFQINCELDDAKKEEAIVTDLEYDLFPKRKSTPYSSQGDGIKFSTSTNTNSSNKNSKSSHNESQSANNKSSKNKPNPAFTTKTCSSGSAKDGTFYFVSTTTTTMNSENQSTSNKSNNINTSKDSSKNSESSDDAFNNLFGEFFDPEIFSKNQTEMSFSTAVQNEIEIELANAKKSKRNDECCVIL